MCLLKNEFLLFFRWAGLQSQGQGHRVGASEWTESKDITFDGRKEMCAYPFLQLALFLGLHTGHLLQAPNPGITSICVVCIQFSFNLPQALGESPI